MGFPVNILHIQDVRATGVNAQTSSAAAKLILNINTVQQNDISGASLLANEVTLPAGTYYISILGTTKRVRGCQLFWHNVTDAAIEIIGMSAYGDNSQGACYLELMGVFTITAAKVFRVEGYTIDAESQGWGLASGEGSDEIYRDVYIEQLVAG